MNITFGMSLDGYEPPKQENSLGAVVTGPSGMLDLLETRLGLSGEWPAQPIRVIQYQQCVETVDPPENNLRVFRIQLGLFVKSVVGEYR